MPQPTPYQRGFSFTDHATQNPATPLPGNAVDTELNSIQQTTAGILNNIALIQRDDGALANGSVGAEQLASDISFGLRSVSDWAPDTQYFQNDGVFFGDSLYRALEGHVSAPDFNTDLTAGRWSLIVGFGGFVTAAENSANAAAVSEAAAAVSETNAATSETNAATSETNASASAAAAAASAGSISLPPAVADTFIQQASDLSGYVTRTAAEVIAILGALVVGDIGSSVQAFDADTLKADVSDQLTAGFTVSQQSLSAVSGNVTPDLAARNVFTHTMTGDITLVNPSNTDTAGSWVIYLTQDGVGGRVVTFDTDYKIASGIISTSQNAVNILYVSSPGDGTYDVVITQRGA